MSERRDDAAKLRLAAERGEVDGVLDAWRSLRDQSLQSLLSDLSNAIAEDRLEDARTLFGQVQERIRERRRETEATTAAVRAVRDPGDLTLETVGSAESVEDLTDYLLAAERTNSQRLALLTRVGAFLTAPDADGTPDASTVRDVVDETATSEEEFDSATPSIESAIDGRTVPAVLAGLSVEVDPASVAPGAESAISASVRNVGDETAEGVTLSIDLPAGVSAPQTTLSMGSIPADDTASATVEVTPGEAGEFSVGVTVTSAGAGTVTESVTVVGSGEPVAGPVERADLNDDGTISTEELQTAITEWAQGAYTTPELQEIITAWATGG